MKSKKDVYNEYTIASFLFMELGYWTECHNQRIVTRLPQLLITGANGKEYRITIEEVKDVK